MNLIEMMKKEGSIVFNKAFRGEEVTPIPTVKFTCVECGKPVRSQRAELATQKIACSSACADIYKKGERNVKC